MKFILGDARYKWPENVQSILREYFIRRRTPPNYFSPPYITATPDVVHVSLLPEDEFVVIASDGLFDELSSEEVVGLVDVHIRGDKSGGKLRNLDGVLEEGGRKQKRGPPRIWVNEDDNVSTHLIRNALGGGDRYRVAQLLSIPSPKSRKYRDDMTVTVLYLDPARTGYLNHLDGVKKTFKGNQTGNNLKLEHIELEKASPKVHHLDRWLKEEGAIFEKLNSRL